MNRFCKIILFCFISLIPSSFAAKCPQMNGRLPIYPGSLAERTLNISDQVDEIENLIQSPDEFRMNFYRREQISATPMDMAAYYNAKIDSLVKVTDKLIESIGKYGPQYQATVKKRISDLIDQFIPRIKMIHNQSNRNEASGQAMAIYTGVKGLAGELHGLISLPNIVAYSEHLGTAAITKDALKTKMEKIRKHLSEHPNALVEYENKFPLIFASPAMKSKTFKSMKERLDFIEKWLSSKEIDFIRQDKERVYWTEFKFNRDEYDVNTFSMKQISQQKEFIRFLGFRNSPFELEIIFTGGLSDRLKKILNDQNIRVIDFSNLKLK